MDFTSTRSNQNVSSAFAISNGLAQDGGLFVPRTFPQLSPDFFTSLIPLSYKERAKKVLSLFLTDFTQEELEYCVNGAYTGSFDNEQPAPLREVLKDVFSLELWHGPTCAFKDLALQILPYLLTTAAKKTSPGRTKVILVATSGDTGKAALEGFADVPGTRIIVFYPQDGVSRMQKLQMTTQDGKNVAVCGIHGNFDDAQTGVKSILTDSEMKETLNSMNMDFSSANSINFGRLVPQVVYYISAYCDLLKTHKVAPGQLFNIAVPTGNFGNILAAIYAKFMGMPVHKFICASNRNNILTDFIRTGVYDRNRPFYVTTSPSMDILISSNLERLLYHLYANDVQAVNALMSSLKENGKYEVSPAVRDSLQQLLYGGSCDDDQTKEMISRSYRENGYLYDTHTAVAADVYRKYVSETGDTRPCIIASTASPYKFAPAVLSAVYGENVPADDFEKLNLLSQTTDTAIPLPLSSLQNKQVRHSNCIEKSEMCAFILDFLKKETKPE